MTRAEILKEFFKKTVLTVVIAYLLFTWGKILFLKDGQVEYFYVALFCSIPVYRECFYGLFRPSAAAFPLPLELSS